MDVFSIIIKKKNQNFGTAGCAIVKAKAKVKRMSIRKSLFVR